MKKQGWILIAVTGAFLCLLLGVFLGRNANKVYIQIQDIQTIQTSPATTRPPESLGKININTADLEQLQLLPGIGESLAQRILDYRAEHGDFKSTEELMNVSGIGEKKFDNIKNFVIIG
ncbi:MAG: ComEA family DNA-binding protein [Oscillospiraceae bacterium]|nr:ComEA family DNA-binding protein [Oscillospiraceae bacterium]